MCFSAEADFAAAAVIGVIAVDAARHVRRRDEIPIAAIPALFGVHSLMSAFAWLGLEGDVSSAVGDAAAGLFALVAFSVFPVVVPWAVWALEPTGPKRRLLAILMAVGVLTGALLLARMVVYGLTATDEGSFIRYRIGGTGNLILAGGYIAATCGSLLLSSQRMLVTYGWLNAAAVVVLGALTRSGFASLWCFWAAITSGVIAIFLRSRRTETQPPPVALQ